MKVRRDRGLCRGRWRTFIQRPGREMEPSQQLAWPGAPPRGWTSGFHSEKYSPGPSLSLQLHLVFHSRRTEPWQSGRNPTAARQGAEGRGAGLGRERGAPGGRAHGATAELCESPAHLLAKGRTQLSTAHSTSRERACACFQDVSLCVSSLTGKMKCLAPVGAGRQKFPNSSLTSLKTIHF